MTNPRRYYVRERASGRWHEVAHGGLQTVNAFCGVSIRTSSIDSRTSWRPPRVARSCAACKEMSISKRALGT